jgi:hypothetical protein
MQINISWKYWIQIHTDTPPIEILHSDPYGPTAMGCSASLTADIGTGYIGKTGDCLSTHLCPPKNSVVDPDP